MKVVVSASPQPLLFFSHRRYGYDSCIISSPFQISVFKTRRHHHQQRFMSLSSSSSSSSFVELQEQDPLPLPLPSPPSTLVDSVDDDPDALPFRACGREQLERGCNGEGRIQGGIATVPGFGWWPIKAYRPCPGFVASGGNYRRRGQSMDEVAFGGGKQGSSVDDFDEFGARKKGKDRRIFKRS